MIRPNRRRNVATLIAVLTLLMAACTPAVPGPTPSASPAPTSGTTGLAPTPTSPGLPEPTATAPAESTNPGTSPPPSADQPTSGALIIEAVASGAIDPSTGLLYRLYALFGDDRLPTPYRGTTAEDNDALDLAQDGLASFSADTQAQLHPFLVRPTDPESYWAPTPAASNAGAVSLAAMARPLAQTATGCTNGWMRQDSSDPDIPVVVWGMCGRGRSDSAVSAQVAEVLADMDDLWPRMTGADPVSGAAFMGPPIPDDQSPPNPAVPEAADGRFDIYVMDPTVTVTRGGREISAGRNIAVNYRADPYLGAAGAKQTASYIVLSNTYSGRVLKSNLAHEFFHGLQSRYNRTGVRWNGGLLGKDQSKFWFVEASAMWAEHHFVPDARGDEDGPYLRYTGRFRSTDKSLSLTDGLNDYASWIWPLFMEQEAGGMTAISDAWKKMVGLTGYEPLQAAVNSVVPFDTRFRDFAVRVYNQKLTPGDPVAPGFWGIDKDFPLDKPAGQRATYGVPVAVKDPLGAHAADLQPLWSNYTELVPQANVHKVTFDFSLLGPPAAVDVDLLLEIKGVWQRTQASLAKEESFCDVDKAIVVISNHASDPATKVSGVWTAIGEDTTCKPAAWSVVLEGPKPGAGTYSGVEESYCSYTPEGGWDGIVYLDPVGGGDIRHLSMGSDYFLVNTRFAVDDPVDWGTATSPGNNNQTTIQADATAKRLVGDSNWVVPRTDGTVEAYHVHAEITCTTWDVQP